jgi:3-oxoacyl-[acyl-carrier-protein] synthase II
MVENKEEMLTPTAFIQSTHNTVGAQIALMLQCHAYNNTFVHRGFSFESAMLDAQMLLEEGQANNVLVGGVDEITDTSHQILERFGLFKDRMDGEGAVFFLLSKEPGGLARLDGMDTFYNPESQEELEKHIQDFLARMKVSVSDIDLILLGNKGSYPEEGAYGLISPPAFKGVETENFKHLCGEYPTASAFALWLATMKIQSGLKRILIYNQAQQTHHSLYLVSACGT